MSGNPRQKKKLLNIARLLLRYSDEEHPLSAAKIAQLLSREGIHCERKSIYRDIKTLVEFGFDIIKTRVPEPGFFLAGRLLEEAQVRLLSDMLRSAKTLSRKKTDDLIGRMKELLSVYQAETIDCGTIGIHLYKSTNEEIFYSIDRIERAIRNRRQISLAYTGRTIRGGFLQQSKVENIRVSPYALMWTEQKYFLVGSAEEGRRLLQLPLDQVKRVQVLERLAHPFCKVYTGCGSILLYDGCGETLNAINPETQWIQLRCENRMIERVWDRFGSSVPMHADGPEHCIIRVQSPIGDELLRWVLSFGAGIEIKAPRSLRKRMRDQIHLLEQLYQDGYS